MRMRVRYRWDFRIGYITKHLHPFEMPDLIGYSRMPDSIVWEHLRRSEHIDRAVMSAISLAVHMDIADTLRNSTN